MTDESLNEDLYEVPDLSDEEYDHDETDGDSDIIPSGADHLTDDEIAEIEGAETEEEA